MPIRAVLFDAAGTLIELEQPGIVSTGVDEHMPLRISRNTYALAEIQTLRHLQEVRDRFKRNIRRGLVRRGPGLGEHGRRNQHRHEN